MGRAPWDAVGESMGIAGSITSVQASGSTQTVAVTQARSKIGSDCSGWPLENPEFLFFGWLIEEHPSEWMI